MDQQKLRVNDLFRRFDGNHDGMLTREEFMKALKASGESEIIGAFSFIIIISFLNERIVNTPQTPSSRLGGPHISVFRKPASSHNILFLIARV